MTRTCRLREHSHFLLLFDRTYTYITSSALLLNFMQPVIAPLRTKTKEHDHDMNPTRCVSSTQLSSIVCNFSSFHSPTIHFLLRIPRFISLRRRRRFSECRSRCASQDGASSSAIRRFRRRVGAGGDALRARVGRPRRVHLAKGGFVRLRRL